MDEQIKHHQQDTAAIIEELLEDGSDPDALYLIEHHLSCNNFDALEKVAVEAFKLGYEVTDPEEIDDLICCDILSEIPLDEELINTQIEQIIKLTAQFKVDYDGWGTYFEDGEEFDDEEFIEESDDQDSLQTLN